MSSPNTCPNCKARLDTSAYSCPSCGKRRTPLGAVLLGVLLPLLGLALCMWSCTRHDAAENPTATLHIYRTRIFQYKYFKAPIMVDGEKAAAMVNGRALTLPMSPGRHTVSVEHPAYSIPLDMKTGQDYYVRVISCGSTGWHNCWHLEPVPADQGKLESADLKSND